MEEEINFEGEELLLFDNEDYIKLEDAKKIIKRVNYPALMDRASTTIRT